MSLRTVFLPYGAALQPLVIFALTHKMYRLTIAQPQDVVFQTAPNARG